MLPVVDLDPFFVGDKEGITRATETVAEACQAYGFFRVVNHGVPAELIARAMELSKVFFALPDEEKKKVRPVEGSKAPLPAGYERQPAHSIDKNEYLMMFEPRLGFNQYPTEPPEFRETMEECYEKLTNLSLLIREILNDCMGLPPGFFKEYNSDRSFDFLAALRYYPPAAAAAAAGDKNGLSGHQDGNFVTLLFQDDVGGLEVLKDGEWVPAEPNEGSIIVNVGDIIQVLSNNKFTSAMHRVTMKGTHRHSFAFFLNCHGEKWIEPLPQFTAAIGEAPRYRGFLYNDYLQLRLKNKTHPPSRPEDVIHITHYAT